MNRLGLMHPSTMTGKHNTEYRNLYLAFIEHASKNDSDSIYTYRLASTGALIGPYGILLHRPMIGQAYLSLVQGIEESSNLSPRIRAIIANVVAANERSAYQTYVHSQQAETQGLTSNELAALQAGLFAQSFDAQDQAAYNLARELCVGSGALSQRLWDETVEALGKDAVIAAVFFIAGQRLISTLLRGFDAQVPVARERSENRE